MSTPPAYPDGQSRVPAAPTQEAQAAVKRRRAERIVTRRVTSVLPFGAILILLGAGCTFPLGGPLQQSATLTPSSSSWPTYTNLDYGFALEYPPNMSLEVQFNQIVLSPEPDSPLYNRWYLRAERDYTPMGAQYFLDTPSNGQTTTGQTTWTTYHLPEGYCDGPGCTPPIYAVRVEFDDVLYTAFFYNHSSLTDLQAQMLSSFRLLE